MVQNSINPDILTIIEKICGRDKITAGFLKDLVLEEVDQRGQWQWKAYYKAKVEEYSDKKEGTKNED